MTSFAGSLFKAAIKLPRLLTATGLRRPTPKSSPHVEEYGGAIPSSALKTKRSDIWIIDCSTKYPRAEPERCAEIIGNMLKTLDHDLTISNVVLGKVERVEQIGGTLRIYTTPVPGVERGSTN